MRALVVLVLLAGCVAEPQRPVEGLPVAERVATTLSGCDILEASLQVPEARVAPHVPAGFRARVSDGEAQVVLGAAACAEGPRAFLAIAVEPVDEALQAEGVRHFYEPEHLVLDGSAFAGALAAARGNATSAEAIDVAAAPPAPGFLVAAGWEHRVEGVGAAVAPASDAVVSGVFREWYAAEGGYGYLEASFGVDGAALGVVPATVTTGEGTVARELLGAQTTAQMFVLAGSAYADASLGFVPR